MDLLGIPQEFRGRLSDDGKQLMLAGMQLTAVPDWVGDLASLTTLDLSFNQLAAVPQSLGNLTALTTLDLSFNQLAAVPQSLGNLTALTTLNLNRNQLAAVPDSLGNLTALTTLNLSINRLAAVPDWVGDLTALTTLNLSGNQLAAVPDSLGNLTALTTLNLRGNRLAAVPDWVGDLTALTTLDLSGNQLAAVPLSLRDLTALTTLNLSRNWLTAVPDWVGDLTALTTLDLSGNQLAAVPDSLGNLTALTTLNLRGNQLAAVPDSLGNLTALSTLDLRGNRLAAVPDSLGNLTALTTLDLRGNQLAVVPDALGNLTALTTLNLSGNQLAVVPDALGNLTTLTTLDLSGNRLAAVPQSLGNLTALTTLDLRGNQLAAVPDSLGNLTALSTLDLRGNRLAAVPDALGNLTALTTLDLRGNQLAAVPDALGNLTALTTLDLSGNQLAVVPDALGNLTALTTLDLSGNQLAAVPDALENLTALTTLNLSGNQLIAVPQSLRDLTALTTLDLSGNQLAAVPDALGNLTALTTLNLSGNQLAAVPDALGNLTALTTLNLSGNQLAAVPDALGNLTALTTLDLSGNQLAAVPDALGNLTALTTLNLSGNQLAAVPDALGNLTALTTLDLSGNQLAVVPDALGNLTALTTLDLSGNQLAAVPDALGNLTALTTLNLSVNQLTAVPQSLGNLTALTTLELSGNQLTALPAQLADLLEGGTQLRLNGNPLSDPLPELAERGLAELATYLRSLHDATPQYEAKLVLVGEGNVGKTSLVAALKGEKFAEGRPTTHGIEISPLTVRHPSLNVNMTVWAWDFGGQEVYRVSHQFFLTRRALYLVVWNARQGQEHDGVEGWLRRIRLRAGSDARTLVVATHCAERLPELDYPHLVQMFPAMLPDASFEVDSCTEQGIDGLTGAISEHAAGLPQMGQLISRRWAAAREDILACAATEPQIPYEQFVRICQGHGLTEPEISTLAKLMHDLGLIIYYADDVGLKDIVVLNPEWLTEAISYVLNDETTRQAAGVLDHARLRQIWHGAAGAYDPRYHPYFLRLMEKFDISYRLEDDETHSLVAQLVPHQCPKLPWEPGTTPPPGIRTLALICRLAEPAPGLISWLTVRHHRASTGMHWRRGVFLRHPIAAYASEALLELRGSSELVVEVHAPSPDLYFNVLRDSIEDLITHRWPGLEYRLLIPCPGGDGSPCPGQFPLDGLLRIRESGQATIVPCMGCGQVYEISALLTGFTTPGQPLAAEVEHMHDQLAGISAGIVSIQARAAQIADTVRRVHRVVSTEVADCPRLFTLAPVRPATAVRRTHIYQHHYRLTLWCEHPGYEHPWEPAAYDLDTPKEWFTRIAPYAVLVFRTLQLIVPAAGAVTVPSLPQAQQATAQAYLQAMGAVLEDLPSTTDRPAPDGGLAATSGQLTAAEGAALRALRATIFQHDPLRAFGGLRRVQAPSGDLLWVCGAHYPDYDPGLPVIR